MPETTARINLSPADRHREVAARFTNVVHLVGDWHVPTPVSGWVARDVVHHLLEWFPAFLAAGDVHLPTGPRVDDDPAAAWEAQVTAVQALVDDEATAVRTFDHPQAGSHQLAKAVDRFYTADVFMHTWDLARAIDVEPALDSTWCEEMRAGMEPIDDLLRTSGHYGPRYPVADDADPQSRLMAFIGRDPAWRPRC